MVKQYDALYIFADTAKDDSMEKLMEKMRNEITRLSGTVLNAELLGKRTFARLMQKRDHGTYARIRFSLDGSQLATLRERYHLIEDLFRVQVLLVDARREALVAEQTAKRRAREAAAAAAMAAMPSAAAQA